MSVVTIRSLGSFGRFGNQLFQYAFARTMSERFGATLQTPQWVGQRLFGLEDPPIDCTMPTLPLDAIPDGPDVDLHGYFQYGRHLQVLSETRIRSWFRFLPRWSERFAGGAAPAVAHLRRGDYESRYSSVYCLISRQSYVAACARYGVDSDRLVWCTDQSPQPADLEQQGLGFLPDFFAMMGAQVLLRANSTFSWWAGVLGQARVLAPVVGGLTGMHDVEFVEGNWPPLTAWHDEMRMGS